MTASWTEAQRAHVEARSFRAQALGDIRLLEIADGPGRGQRILQLRNAAGLEAEIAVDRGFDVAALRYRGINLGWKGPSAYPAPADLSDDNGLGLLRSFEGFLVTCGLDHHGLPAQGPADHFIYPNRDKVVYPLHGRVSNVAAVLERYAAVTEDQDPHLICTGIVRQVAVFGEVLELRRTIRMSLLTARIELFDNVTNRGARPARHGLLYHFNFGWPLLDEQTQLSGFASDFPERFAAVPPVPAADVRETFDLVEPDSAPASLTVSNPKLAGLSVELSYDAKDLPRLGVWRAYQSGLFALGIEPHTPLLPADEPYSPDRLDFLAPGESRDYRIGILATARDDIDLVM